MTKEKKPPAPLAIDEQSYLKAMDDLTRRVEMAEYIADTWNANGILPRMDAESFWQCINDFWHLENFYAETFAANMDSQIPGMGSAYLQQGNRAKPANYERARFQRYCEAINKPMAGTLTEYAGPHLISWKDGKPYITDQTRQDLKDSYSAFETAENKKIINLGKQLADISNELAQAMTAHSQDLLPSGVVLPPQQTPRVIDFNPHQPGYKSQSPVKLDAISGQYSFNAFCLKYGVQTVQKPPLPPPPAPEKKANIPLRKEVNPYKLQRIQSTL